MRSSITNCTSNMRNECIEKMMAQQAYPVP
ncbi:hypothetical protein C5167_000944 [Papaver somniferum]|uniref:Uncharacterized protein n=1 Tax=Papaver somniferum TaxID=3469 RepID=A0A4Y7KXM5_PAPSO|nr:hypothetical protein C5167_000944 [Papaver somniferum]